MHRHIPLSRTRFTYGSSCVKAYVFVFAGEAFHSAGVHMQGNAGASSWLHQSPGIEPPGGNWGFLNLFLDLLLTCQVINSFAH